MLTIVSCQCTADTRHTLHDITLPIPRTGGTCQHMRRVRANQALDRCRFRLLSRFPCLSLSLPLAIHLCRQIVLAILPCPASHPDHGRAGDGRGGGEGGDDDDVDRADETSISPGKYRVELSEQEREREIEKVKDVVCCISRHHSICFSWILDLGSRIFFGTLQIQRTTRQGRRA